MTANPAAERMRQFFSYNHLPEHLQAISAPCAALVTAMFDAGLDGPEFTAGLRKLLEAKDCFVRAAIDKGYS
jgi:hypothetical protein